MFENAIIEFRGMIKLAIVDHITKPSAIMLPVRKIAKALQSEGIRILVDGAHGPGQGKL